MTDEQYQAWLSSSDAVRVVLIEAQVNVDGVEMTRYLSTRGYVTGAGDVPANTDYLPFVVDGGVRYQEELPLDGEAALSFGDIELYNPSGVRDGWLSDVWTNRTVKAYIGDARWPRADFRLIMNGVIADIDSRARDRLNIKVRDKLQRLNTPVSEQTLGGATPNKDALIPLAFGECHNVTPLLKDPATLTYGVHSGPIERLIEVRDNGKPVAVIGTLSAGEFKLTAQSRGAITASIQGDNPGAYTNTIAGIIQRLVTAFGSATERFTAADIDLDNFAAFNAAHPQPVGVYLDGRENLLSVCHDLADSVGARLVLTRAGQLRLVQVALPAAGVPRLIDGTMMVQNTLRIAQRTDVVAAVKIGFCKEWTVQAGLQTTIPADHKSLFATEWLTETASDAAVKAAYRLNAEPVQQDTLLLVRADAASEADRRLDLYKVPRMIYQFEGTSSLLTLELGQPVTLKHRRFNLAGGVDGMVVSLEPNWNTGRIMVGVLA